jgi:serine/threonine-protein phosphatase 2A regulatory subunit B''
LTGDELRPLCTSLMGLPVYFGSIIVKRFSSNGNKISMAIFVEVWKEKLIWRKPVERAFFLLDSKEKNYLIGSDFMSMMTAVMEIHPGLNFLKETPEFQEKYGTTLSSSFDRH